MSAVISIKVSNHVTMGEIYRLVQSGVEFTNHGDHYYFESSNAELVDRMQRVNKL